MKPANSLSPRMGNKPTFSAALTGNAMQALIAKSMPDKGTAARFTATLLSVVSASEQLKACEPTSIVTAALRGESMNLIYGHGYYITPYGDQATFVLGYKGMIQLAMASGAYNDIDCIEIREGEKKGRDPRTGKVQIDLSVYDDDAVRESKPIIGYYAYYELKDGMFRYEYWPMEKLLKHAERYSPAFSMEKYQKLVSGELPENEVKKLSKSSPWYDAYGQDRMCRKTVIRQLLNSGYAPLSNETQRVLDNDAKEESGETGTGIIVDNVSVIPDTAEKPAETKAQVLDSFFDAPPAGEGN
jgi:recombination protein RecT